MQAWMMFAGLIVAVIGQRLNRYKANNTELVKLGLVVSGLMLYLPIEQPWVEGFLPWFENAWLWAVAVPGIASLVGMHPALKTDSK